VSVDQIAAANIGNDSRCKADWIERVTQINTHHIELFAYSSSS
jgi:hypothetical protein